MVNYTIKKPEDLSKVSSGFSYVIKQLIKLSFTIKYWKASAHKLRQSQSYNRCWDY